MLAFPFARHAAGFASTIRRLLPTLLRLGTLLLSTLTLAHADPPVVTSYGPTSGPVGTTVVIGGSGFDSSLKVRFDGTSSTDTFTGTEIRAVVPADAQTGPLTVTTADGAARAGIFTVVPVGPGVSVKVITPTAFAPGGSAGGPGVVTVSLRSPAVTDVIVNYKVGGSAVNGQDYKLLKGSVRIAAGTASRNVKVVPLGRLDGATRKTVKLTLQPGGGYTLDDRGPVKVKILANLP